MLNDDSAADGFVAGFSQANVGDTTPNVEGAWCDDGSGEQCSFENSTCADGKSQSCHGRGPFFRELDLGVKSCHEIGRRQYAGAKDIMVRHSSLPLSCHRQKLTLPSGFHRLFRHSYCRLNRQGVPFLP